MPELPEVEVCRLGISPHVVGQLVSDVIVRHWQLRWPVSENIQELVGQRIEKVERRSKYLLLQCAAGTLVLHLGMSGTVRVIADNVAVARHDHFDLCLANGKALRLNDPRRFGAVLWFSQGESLAGILGSLGPEPLEDEFSAKYLYDKSRKRSVNIKNFLMNNKVVVGVGNIYANEALFKAHIQPVVPAGKLSLKQCQVLTLAIKQVLTEAIAQGGTTLKDFTQADGRPGYFAQSLFVYGRGALPCLVCSEALIEIRQGGRSSVYCPQCQKG
jgi:formamidopyrimidine-DNA glycosylase